MLGATSNIAVKDSRTAVSILSQLRCWEQPGKVVSVPETDRVSILSQLRCWEQLDEVKSLVEKEKFQSSPSLGAGSNRAPSRQDQVANVSILSQLRCWEQLYLYC